MIRRTRKTLAILACLTVLLIVVAVVWVYFGSSGDKPVQPTTSGTHDLQGLRIPIADHWITVGNEESLTARDGGPDCQNIYGKGCGVLTVVVRTDYGDPDDYMQAYKNGCKKKADYRGERKIGSRNAHYYVIDPCVAKSNTSSDTVRYLWYIPNVVFVLLTNGPDQKRMAGVDEALAGAIWR